ncbi:MAG: hypothetical protein K2W96_04915 [Gemmataceae bacterium]|nr:hypothetical protein [Gemmataceae bacterium]
MRWTLIGAGAGAAVGAALLGFLHLAAGARVAAEEAAWAYAGFAGMSAALGALQGWTHATAPTGPTLWGAVRRESAAGLRMGYVFGLLYAATALGIFLGAGPPMPLWFLALRAGLALSAFTLLFGMVGGAMGWMKHRAAKG